MNFQSVVYRTMRRFNDARAVSETLETGNPNYILNRIGRRAIGRASAKLQRTLFPPIRRPR